MLLFFHLSPLIKTGIILLITILTLLGIMLRPWKVNEAIFALCGATLLLLLGLITPDKAFTTLLDDWNTFLFFLGLMSISALAEAAGLFNWLAFQAARLSRNSTRLLFLNTFLLGSLISMFFSNDATALILTPIIYTMVTRFRLPVLPFLFACTFIADTASFLLPVSNPINIIVMSHYPLDLPTFVRLLTLPCLLVIAINLGVFYLLYRKQLNGRFDLKLLPSVDEAIEHQGYFRYTCCILILVGAAYITASALQVPLSLIALGGALLLLIGALFWRQISIGKLGRQISWQIFGFIGGMFVIIQALQGTGLTLWFGQWLLTLSGGTPFGTALVSTVGSALGTNLINNIPMAAVMNSSLQGMQHSPLAIQHGFIAATIFGCDLGPNLTTVGSLATVLWLLILRQRKIEVSGLDYFKVGLIVTPLMLLAGAVAIWLLL